MIRRIAAGIARRLPALLVGGALVLVPAAALLAACGGEAGGGSAEPTTTVTVTASPSAASPAAPSASPSPTPAATPVTLYFIRDGVLCAVERRLDDASDAGLIRALLRGPTAAEQAAGVTTGVPRDVRLLDVRSEDGEATVDVSGAFARAGDGAQVQWRLAQVVYTATGPAIGARRVALLVNGVPVDGLPSSDGDVEFFAYRRGYRELEPAILVERPGLGAALSSPFTLSGTASVYEGSFTARLVDGNGRRIVSTPVQASRGAPGRGGFSEDIAFSTSAAAGTLVVSTQSMEDGSQQNVVRIPVTFSGM